MKKILIIFLFAFLVSASSLERWEVVGLSGTANPVEMLNDSENGIFVPVYQVWRHLNLPRNDNSDALIARFGQNELRILRNSKTYLLNGNTGESKFETLVRNGITYSDVESFCDIMKRLTNLYFIADFSARRIRVSRTAPATLQSQRRTPPQASQPAAQIQTPRQSDTLRNASATASTVSPPASNTDSAAVLAENITGIVVIDPGHGGRDPGAIGPTGVMEKDIVLAISHELRTYLARYPGIVVYMTRDDDVFVPLRSRTEFANKKNADIFVSIHTNASENANVGGYKMYFLSEANNEMDEMTARIENSVLELEGIDMSQLSDLEALLLSLANSEFIRESQDLSIMLERSFARNLTEFRRLHTGVGQANFLVLAGAAMPAVLVEAGFISNLREEKLLSNGDFQRRAGESIGQALLEFLRKYPSAAVGR